MNRISRMLIAAATAASLAGVAERTSALPTVGTTPGGDHRSTVKATAGACNPATATIDLDINDVRARMMTGGDMWWDRGTGTARYEVPKGSGKSSLFAGSVWVGGYDDNNQLKVAAQTYRTRGNDYWPGPTQTDAAGVNLAPDNTICSDWDKFWKIDKATLIEFTEYQRTHRGQPAPRDEKYQSINQWPATGNINAIGASGSPLSILTNQDYINHERNYAPFVDYNGDKKYNTDDGDYPDVQGDQYIWWVFNDMGNVKLQTGTPTIGMEVQTAAFAFSSKDFLNDATFIFYKLINRGTLNLRNTYMATWTDADLGDAQDDYIGCDTNRSLGILYNGKSIDGSGKATDYGSQVPMIGVDFFIGPKRRTYLPTGEHIARDGRRYHEDTLGMTVFNYFNNDPGAIGDPTNGLETYRIMTGFNRNGAHLHNDQASCPGSTCYGPGPDINYTWPGNPEVAGDWSECICGTTTGDRRFVHSSGPFTLEAGGITNDIIIGACWVPNVGGCPNTSFSRIRAADDLIQDLFDNHFRTIEGPEAPRLAIREMDRKLIFYIVNDSVSTNFQEKFGYDPAGKYRVSTPRTRRYGRSGDSLYKFEGYRVFQLKNSSIKPNNIFNSNGEVDQTVAQEVFTTDIKNDVTGKIFNHVSNPDKGLGNYDAQEKVLLTNAGIQHSFQLSNDAFATGADKRFVNYRNYYFVAIAFAYNNYIPFSYQKSDSAQLVPYLESSHAAGGRVIPVDTAMPNPANGNMGTEVRSDYGDGVVIRRIEGIGNGGNATVYTDSTEQEILARGDHQVTQPVYKQGAGPVSVKVIDPLKVIGANWELYLNGPTYAQTGVDTARGLNAVLSSWKLVNSNHDTIYSEKDLSAMNEQIAEKYGLAITIQQVGRPGDTTTVPYTFRNGLITSYITFADPNQIWMAGVPDGEQQSPLNWIRSGNFAQPKDVATCNYADVNVKGMSTDNNPDPSQFYESLLAGSTLSKGSWAPAVLGAVEPSGNCGFGVASEGMHRSNINLIQGVDIVFTSDKTKWTKCVVLELQDEATLSEGHAKKFDPRKHRSWTGQLDGNGNPIYSTNGEDNGFSYFPGYAINTETGTRVNMAFGEDSYLTSDQGNDMIWNPSSRIIDQSTGNVVFGGKHYIYVLSSKYDEDSVFYESLQPNYPPGPQFNLVRWIGLPTLASGQKLLSLQNGLIPTETRVSIRVTRPYGRYIDDENQTLRNNGFPLYSFSTNNLTARTLTDADNEWANNKNGLLDQIFVSPNPYYGYTGYESGRLDTRVRILNLPRRATISIYSTDGTLIRTLTKDNANQSYVDWDTRNAKGLAIASGMYLVHVQADGIGEKVIRWFGAMRPIDITTY